MSQKKESFLRSVEHSFHYFGGVTKAVVPDNLKSAVIKASKYEPEINPLVDDFADYYRTIIIPTRAYRPKDKALAENAVRLMYQRVFAPLRNHVFHSLDELNKAIIEKVEEPNNKRLQVLQISRYKLFNEIEKSEPKTLPSAPYPMKFFENHKFYASWSVEKFESWAASIGEETLNVIRHLLESRHHPEQAFKSCMGILSLASKCENHDLNMACRKAWNFNRISYREVKAYLEDIIRLKKINCDEKQIFMFERHSNLRNTVNYQ